MSTHHVISTGWIKLSDVSSIINENKKLGLSDEVKKKVIDCRNYLDQKILNQDEPIYGVTTGFGSLCNHSISRKELGTLQKNLVMSHACGIGEEIAPELVKLMLLLKIQSLAYGKSGVKLETVERLVGFYNHDILPVIYTQGSLGASGDLAPLAHLSLPLIGMGEVDFKGRRMGGSEMLEIMEWKPLELASKEGLALLNGTQFMSALGVRALLRGAELNDWADVISSLSVEGFDGRIEAYLPQVHEIRHHAGQKQSAANLRKMLEGSQLTTRTKIHVQDPYSFRCIPQVHGATRDAINYVSKVFEDEINAVTDNPTIFPEDDLIISAGNFHGQPLAITLDFLGIAISELGNIAESRVYRLISGGRGLPPFLVANPGLNSGFMIPQYTAASILSQNKQFCTPSSVDSIESSQGQEDHVSMGANAAVKTLKIIDNIERILGIELMNASQAMGFRDARKTSPRLKKLLDDYRKLVPFVENDKVLYVEMEKSVKFIKENSPSMYLKG